MCDTTVCLFVCVFSYGINTLLTVEEMFLLSSWLKALLPMDEVCDSTLRLLVSFRIIRDVSDTDMSGFLRVKDAVVRWTKCVIHH